jgi:hypothetical protein
LLCSSGDSVATYTYRLIAAALHRTTLENTTLHHTSLHFTSPCCTALHLAMCELYGDYHNASPPATIIWLSLPLFQFHLPSAASPFSLSPILHSSITFYTPPPFYSSFSYPLHALIPSSSSGFSCLHVSHTMPSHDVIYYTSPSLLYLAMPL